MEDREEDSLAQVARFVDDAGAWAGSGVVDVQHILHFLGLDGEEEEVRRKVFEELGIEGMKYISLEELTRALKLISSEVEVEEGEGEGGYSSRLDEFGNDKDDLGVVVNMEQGYSAEDFSVGGDDEDDENENEENTAGKRKSRPDTSYLVSSTNRGLISQQTTGTTTTSSSRKPKNMSGLSEHGENIYEEKSFSSGDGIINEDVSNNTLKSTEFSFGRNTSPCNEGSTVGIIEEFSDTNTERGVYNQSLEGSASSIPYRPPTRDMAVRRVPRGRETNDKESIITDKIASNVVKSATGPMSVEAMRKQLSRQTPSSAEMNDNITILGKELSDIIQKKEMYRENRDKLEKQLEFHKKSEFGFNDQVAKFGHLKQARKNKIQKENELISNLERELKRNEKLLQTGSSVFNEKQDLDEIKKTISILLKKMKIITDNKESALWNHQDALDEVKEHMEELHSEIKNMTLTERSIRDNNKSSVLGHSECFSGGRSYDNRIAYQNDIKTSSQNQLYYRDKANIPDEIFLQPREDNNNNNNENENENVNNVSEEEAHDKKMNESVDPSIDFEPPLSSSPRIKGSFQDNRKSFDGEERMKQYVEYLDPGATILSFTSDELSRLERKLLEYKRGKLQRRNERFRKEEEKLRIYREKEKILTKDFEKRKKHLINRSIISLGFLFTLSTITIAVFLNRKKR